MKYSIIIPTLNEEKLLPGLLDSMNNREDNKYDFEIIVSDGGSSDDTIKIAEKLADKTLLHTNGDVRTISSGRAKGANAASGEILIFTNADVRINIYKLFQIIEEKFIDTDYAAMTTKTKIYPEDERRIDKIVFAFLNNYFRLLNLLGMGMARGECQVIRKDVYQNAGGYKKDLYAGEDFELFTRIRREGKVLFIKDFIVYESPRRYRKWGYFKILCAWFLNSSSSLIFKKSFYKSWELVR